MSSNYEAALRLAAANLPVFPCDPATKRPRHGCRWTLSATVVERGVTNLWKHYGMDSMAGIHLGLRGLLDVDIDNGEGEDGGAAFDALLGKYGELPNCPIVATSSGSFHLCFKQPSNREPLGNAPGSLPKHIDVRGSGGFVIGPGAVNANGLRYEPAALGSPDLIEAFVSGAVPDLPAWLLEIITKPRHGESSRLPSATPRMFSNDDETLKRLRRMLEEGPFWDIDCDARITKEDDRRNTLLNKRAFRCAQFAARV
jgi:hypothetical protein